MESDHFNFSEYKFDPAPYKITVNTFTKHIQASHTEDIKNSRKKIDQIDLLINENIEKCFEITEEMKKLRADNFELQIELKKLKKTEEQLSCANFDLKKGDLQLIVFKLLIFYFQIAFHLFS